VAAGLTLLYVFWSAARQPSLEAIRRAFAAKRWEEVEGSLRRWLDLHPRDGNAWEMLGGVLFDRGRIPEAKRALLRVRPGDDGWVNAQVLIGEIAVRERNLAEAEAAFRRACEREPRAVEPLKRLKAFLTLERRTAEARAVMRRVFELTRDPHDLADSILVSQTETEVHDLGVEIEEFLRQAPDDPWLRRVWGLFLLSRGRAAEALPHLEAAALAFENDPVGRFAWAECRMALGDAGGDLGIMGTPPSRAVDAARWWMFRGRLAEAWGCQEAALESFKQAAAANPKSSEAHHRLGQALVRRGDRGGGQAQFNRADALGLVEDRLRRELRQMVRQAFDAASLVRIGRLCLEAGMAVEARDWFELARARDPRQVLGEGDLPRLARSDDGPAVALSSPVLKAAGRLPRGAGPAPHPPFGHLLPVGEKGSRSGAEDRYLPATRPPPVRFEDIAEGSRVRFRYDCGAPSYLFIGDTMGGGVGLFDFDDDGWLDIYFVNGCPLPFDHSAPPHPNKLFRNLGNGAFEDVTQSAGARGRGYGMGCAVADFDHDGHDDLFLTGLNQTVLYRNKGDGTFEDVTVRAGVSSTRWTTAAGFADLDSDGDLDLVVVTYVEAPVEDVVECRDKAGRLIHCQPERFPAQFDHLFRNNGDGTFTDVSRAAGIEVPEGKGLGLAIADFDGDGLLDLFVANDGTPNFLFRNLGGLKFEEVGQSVGVAYDGSGRPTASMGVVAEDFNGDGRIDLYHTNFIEQTNTLRFNLGGGLFCDGTLAANLAAPSRAKTGFGTVALDVDNDGILDVFVANGHTDDQPWANIPMAQTAQLFLGHAGGRFELAGPEVSPYFAAPVVGRGVAAGDLDNDGRVDLVVVHRDAPAAVLKNVTPGGHWFGLRLRGTRSGRNPVGACVVACDGGRYATRWFTSGTSYLSSSDPTILFGLGAARQVERLEVRWPSGAVQHVSGLTGDRILGLREAHN
jgi:tetratricopeptide (TPR) repeat protein